MANTYQEIKALTTGKNNMGLSNTIKRDYGIPLDYSSIQESYEAALEYAQNSTLAYIGQPIAVGDTLYIVTDEEGGYLKAVGTQPKGDNKSIEVSADGTVSICGFEAASPATLPRKVSDGTIEWVSISAIVEGADNTKTFIEVADDSAISIDPVYDSVNDTYTYTLDVTLPPIPEYSISATDAIGAVTYKLTKDGTAVGEAIVVPKAYDDTALQARVAEVEADVADHEDRIAEIETFFDSAAVSDEVIDTLKEIQDYISGDETGAGEMLASINSNKAAIDKLNGSASIEGSVAKTVADAVSAHETSVAATYAKKSDLTALEEAAATKAELEEISDDLANYAKKSDVYTKSEVDNAIEEASSDAEEVADDLAAHIETYNSKISALEQADSDNAEAIQDNADAIADIVNETNGILAQAKTYAESTAAAKVKVLEDGKVATNAGKIASLEGQVETVISNVNNNMTEIAGLKSKDAELSGQISTEVTLRQNADSALSDRIDAAGEKISALEAKDSELANLIQANTDKFNDYYTKTEADNAIAAKIAENNTANNETLNEAINANTQAITAEITRATNREKDLADLISANAENIASNASEISRLETAINSVIENDDGKALNSIKELAAWISEHDTDLLPVVQGHTTDLETLKGDVNTAGSVAKTVADAIAAIPAATATTLGLVKTSEEIEAPNGILTLRQVSTDKLVNGDSELVLCGGNANGATPLI